ncbi:MAG: hypothetical protein ABI212_09415 [Burkholderiaceae bacterium]
MPGHLIFFEVFRFSAVGQPVSIDCDDASATEVLWANFAAMAQFARGGDTAPEALSYRVRVSHPGALLTLSCRGESPADFVDMGKLLYALEKDLTISLQRRRPDLLFLHAAALERGGRGYLLAGDSGNGKSTTAWGLLHRRFCYLSDELSPIDTASMQVHAYPHALCMKSHPPPTHPLPPSTIVQHLGTTMHVPVASFPAAIGPAVCPIEAIVFVRYARELTVPVLRKLGSAEAGARLYTTALNALAHSERGLDAVLHIASKARCFVLETADLDQSCDLFCNSVASVL